LKTFAIIGVAGYIATRHLQAIKETRNNLLVALDPSYNIDSFLDKFFSENAFLLILKDWLVNKRLIRNCKLNY
jgi:UDP-N-acetyl-2-amino-2-deoxyglucuronate dehydrogenase